MKRADLEHIIRAAGNIADAQRLFIIGSQAILGSYPDAPAELTVSAEADADSLVSDGACLHAPGPFGMQV